VIARVYGQLGRINPSPVVELNRAVAVGMAQGPDAGLALLDALAAGGALGTPTGRRSPWAGPTPSGAT
jgi:predicted RNA polymerase sigma factor